MTIDWSKFETYQGEARLLPVYLQDIISAKLEDREASLNYISWAIAPNLYIYEAGYYLLDMLIDILMTPNVVKRHGLSLLWDIVTSHSNVVITTEKGHTFELERCIKVKLLTNLHRIKNIPTTSTEEASMLSEIISDISFFFSEEEKKADEEHGRFLEEEQKIYGPKWPDKDPK